jgi:hypothetical protein
MPVMFYLLRRRDDYESGYGTPARRFFDSAQLIGSTAVLTRKWLRKTEKAGLNP